MPGSPRPRAKHVRDAWEDLYRLALAPQGIERESVQYLETRRAFYAGATSVYFLLEAIGNDHVSEDAGVELLEDLKNEIDEFGGEVARRAANADTKAGGP